jgi:hypothetical protein
MLPDGLLLFSVRCRVQNIGDEKEGSDTGKSCPTEVPVWQWTNASTNRPGKRLRLRCRITLPRRKTCHLPPNFCLDLRHPVRFLRPSPSSLLTTIEKTQSNTHSSDFLPGGTCDKVLTANSSQDFQSRYDNAGAWVLLHGLMRMQICYSECRGCLRNWISIPTIGP